VKKNTGYTDILYNNAGIANKWENIFEIPLAEWEEVFRVNLFAMVQLCNTFAPIMRKRGYGRIINLTSAIKDTPHLSPYGVTKAAVDRYTQDLAVELKDSNVLVSCLEPGWLKTDLGGENALYDVGTVLPGALIPALLKDHGPNGRLYLAQDYSDIK